MTDAKTEGSRHMGLNVDTTVEDLSDTYKVMTHVWLLAQMRQLGRPLHSDLAETTFNSFLDELLSANARSPSLRALHGL